MRGKHPVYDHPWPIVRAQILKRDGGICQIRGPKCKGIATQVDHIVPVTQGGAWYDAANLRASCGPCNLSRVDHSGAEGWKRSATKITLVVGPPHAGKAAYVERVRRDGDLIVDYEAIAEALGGQDQALHATILKARGSILSDLRRGKVKAKRAYIVSANPRAEELFPFHERVVIDPGEQICLDAASNDEQRTLIGAWYRARSGESDGQTGSSPSREWLSKA